MIINFIYVFAFFCSLVAVLIYVLIMYFYDSSLKWIRVVIV